MLKVGDGWWTTKLKDASTSLYARVDVIRRTDDSLSITVNISELSAEIEIIFENGELSFALIRRSKGKRESVWKETMALDGKFVWKEEDNSNQG